jgi:hypothetical protein
MMATLEAARDALAEITGVASCKIGLETGISPIEWPLIRLVPDRLLPGKPYGHRTVEVSIFFGMDIGESEDGLQAVYAAAFELEAAILVVLKTLQGRYLETVTDSDRLPTYKLMAVRCELVG